MLEFGKTVRRNGQKCVDVKIDGKRVGYLCSKDDRRWKPGIDLCHHLGIEYHGRRPAKSLTAAKEELLELLGSGE